MLSFNPTNTWLKTTTCIRSPLPRLRRLRERPPLPRCIQRRSAWTSGVSYSTASYTAPDTTSVTGQRLEPMAPLELPVCCGTGCHNCVWIQYADELARRYKDGGQRAVDAIERVGDPMLRSFLLTEIAMQQRSK